MNQRDEIERVYEYLFTAASAIVKSGQQHAPILFHSANLGRPIPLWQLPKQAWPALQQSVVDRFPGTFAVFITEAWHAVVDKDEVDTVTMQPRDGVMPSDRDDKQEALIFSFLGADWQALGLCPITRDGEVKVEKKPLTFVGEKSSDGRPSVEGGAMIRPQQTKH